MARFPYKLHALLIQFYHQSQKGLPTTPLIPPIDELLRRPAIRFTRRANAAAKRRGHCRHMAHMDGREARLYMARYGIKWANVKQWKEWELMNIQIPRIRRKKHWIQENLELPVSAKASPLTPILSDYEEI